MNYDLIELTIYFDDSETESELMIVSLDSMAHEFVKDYVKVNGYKLTEKPLNN
jgi:hypothetical protein